MVSRSEDGLGPEPDHVCVPWSAKTPDDAACGEAFVASEDIKRVLTLSAEAMESLVKSLHELERDVARGVRSELAEVIEGVVLAFRLGWIARAKFDCKHERAIEYHGGDMDRRCLNCLTVFSSKGGS